MKYLGDRVEAEHLLSEQNVGRLGIYSESYPYVIPVCYVYYKHSIYIHSKPSGKKIDLIRNNSKICFQVDRVNEIRSSDSPCNYGFKYHSAIVYGTIEEVDGYDEKLDALIAITNVYVKEYNIQLIEDNIDDVVILKINLDEVTIKINE